MNYSVKLYKANENNTSRFVLGIGKPPLIIFGLNPNTADDKKPDPTIRKIMNFIEKSNDFDSFIMLNLYPQRTPKPEELDKIANNKLLEENINEIKLILECVKNPTILAIWWDNFKKRKYFKDIIELIYESIKIKGIKWKKFWDLTIKWQPRHPLYMKSDLILLDFDIEDYIKRLKI